MPANASIVLADGKGTPENHTFNPMGIDGFISRYANLTDATYTIGQEKLTIRTKTERKRRHVVVQLTVPRLVEETVNSVTVPSAPDFATAKAELILPETWSEADITDLRVLLSNALLNTLVEDLVDTGAFVY